MPCHTWNLFVYNIPNNTIHVQENFTWIYFVADSSAIIQIIYVNVFSALASVFFFFFLFVLFHSFSFVFIIRVNRVIVFVFLSFFMSFLTLTVSSIHVHMPLAIVLFLELLFWFLNRSAIINQQKNTQTEEEQEIKLNSEKKSHLHESILKQIF